MARPRGAGTGRGGSYRAARRGAGRGGEGSGSRGGHADRGRGGGYSSRGRSSRANGYGSASSGGPGGNNTALLVVICGGGLLAIVLIVVLLSQGGTKPAKHVATHTTEKPEKTTKKDQEPAPPPPPPRLSDAQQKDIREAIAKIAADEPRAQKLIDDGFRLHQAQHFDAANEKWTKAVDLLRNMLNKSEELWMKYGGDDGYRRVQYWMPRVYESTGRWDNMIAQVQKYLR